MSQKILRILIVLAFALPAAVMGAAFAPAEGSTPTPVAPAVSAPGAGAAGDEYVGPETCKVCHSGQYRAWQNTLHATTLDKEGFQESWQSVGAPGYCLSCHTTGFNANTGQYAQAGVTCENCHGPLQSGHPGSQMTIQLKSEACIGCHVETDKEWEISGHGQAGVGCTSCHNQHSMTLRSGSATTLCATCHAERAQDFAHAPHAGADLTCADCHVTSDATSDETGQHRTGHTFVVNTAVCADCHKDQIHVAGQTAADGSGGTGGAGVAQTNPPSQSSLLPAPQPVSPIGYALLAAVVGLGVGIVVAPWLEKAAIHVRKEA